MAITRMSIVVNARMDTLRHPLENPDRPTKPGESGTCPGCKPRKLSIVVNIGRALRTVSDEEFGKTVSLKRYFGYGNDSNANDDKY